MHCSLVHCSLVHCSLVHCSLVHCSRPFPFVFVQSALLDVFLLSFTPYLGSVLSVHALLLAFDPTALDFLHFSSTYILCLAD